jgi:hypothetical protein
MVEKSKGHQKQEQIACARAEAGLESKGGKK